MDEEKYQMSSIVIKDSYKADIFNFDMELWKQEEPKGELFNFTINNVISWEWQKLKLTREELKGLANFINSFIDETTDNPVVKRGASQTSCGVE
jgi:hypothetical protein